MWFLGSFDKIVVILVISVESDSFIIQIN